MPYSASKKICLAIFVKPNTRISSTALLLAKPFINSWVISSSDMESQEELPIRNILAGIEGRFLCATPNDYGHAKTTLVQEAQQSADWVLLLDANEELCVFEADLQIPQNSDIGLVDISRGKVITSEARLFSASADVRFKYPVGETANIGDARTAPIVGCIVSSRAPHQDLIEDTLVNRFLLDAVLGKFAASAELELTLGRIELSGGRLELALGHFEAIQGLAATDSVLWMAHYLAGGIYEAQGNLAPTMKHWQAAFELSPNRAEPLMRLAELHFKQNEYVTAALLADEASNIDNPTLVDYHEPDIYTHTADILKARAWHQAARSDEAIVCLNELSKRQLSDSIKVEVLATLSEIERELTVSSALAERSKGAISDSIAPSDHISTDLPEKPKLTIGMATHDDYDGVYFSVMSLVLYHRERLDDIEILIIDNNPNSKHGEAVRGLAKRVAQIRYVAAQEYRGTAIRERVFQEAKAEYVLCMDCHVFLHTGVLGRLIDYFDANPNSADILHGPIYYDDHNNFSTHMTKDWYGGFYGRWGTNPQGGEDDNAPFEIPMQGLGLFACVKSQWPGFNLKFRGFGGEEGYIHEKFRQHGGKAMCLPFLRWTHRFDRPNAPTYTNSWEDRIRNYLIGWDELGLDLNSILAHFSQMLGKAGTSAEYSRFLIEKSGPFWGYDTIYLYSEVAFSSEVLCSLGAHRLIQNVSSKAELQDLLHRSKERGLPKVLLFIAKTQNELEFETAICQSLADFESLKKGSDEVKIIESPMFQASLIASTAFQKVANCFENESLLDPEKLRATPTTINSIGTQS